MKKTQLFIGGTPGCGKSTFGRWLAREKQFVLVDMEHAGLDDCGFRASWEEFCSGADTRSFLQAIRRHSSSVVLDWGFPPSWIEIVRRLKDGGVKMFWFEGDRLASRDYFIKRATVPVSAFDSQYAAISSCWTEIEAEFGDHIIRTVHADGTLVSPETICKQIFG